MRKKLSIILASCFTAFVVLSFRASAPLPVYQNYYNQKVSTLRRSLQHVITAAERADLKDSATKSRLRLEIHAARKELKQVDFWFRYLEPLAYKKINSPLPVEWETEVFEKFEPPYRREGAGLTLAELYLDEDQPSSQHLSGLLRQALQATETYQADSVTTSLNDYHHLFFCNRLYLLNLAAIYTTGFECPTTDSVVSELLTMMRSVGDLYAAFNKTFPDKSLPKDYLTRYNQAITYVQNQPKTYDAFDHFTFIRDYVNPLFLHNQQLINQYKAVSRSMLDYALNKKEIPIFSKGLYNGQNAKGIFLRVTDSNVLADIDKLGKLLFYDPILSGNNERSCASCHKPTSFFTDTAVRTALQFNRGGNLTRNAPTLINAAYNHLAMVDGKHYTLQNQARAVMLNELEMGSKEDEIVDKVMSCPKYETGFKRLLKYTPTEKRVTIEHISSALTFYYHKFSRYESPFDSAMNQTAGIEGDVRAGFNLFMSKAQCATCHFPPQFNGVKPPYIGSEFEVIGVPADPMFSRLSEDKGRYLVNPADETMNAFRTGAIRNAAKTHPYMHNGVFQTLEEVIDFYDAGGGAGRGLHVPNQTLPTDSLRLSPDEKRQLIAFIKSLNEAVSLEPTPTALPRSRKKDWNKRKVGGSY